MENTSLTEVITIYQRMHKGRPNDTVYRLSKFGLPKTIDDDDNTQTVVEETIPLVPSFHQGLSTLQVPTDEAELAPEQRVQHSPASSTPTTQPCSPCLPRKEEENSNPTTQQFEQPTEEKRRRPSVQRVPSVTIEAESPEPPITSILAGSNSNLSYISLGDDLLDDLDIDDDDNAPTISDCGLSSRSNSNTSSKPQQQQQYLKNPYHHQLATSIEHQHNNANNKHGGGSGGASPQIIKRTHPASNILDFNKFKFLRPKKYIFFSKATNMIHSNNLQDLSKDYVELLKSKSYWLNIRNPNESDLSILFSSFNVHDLTISDIREGNTEEKIEIFKHYTFISMRLMCSENSNSCTSNSSDASEREDMDFNILLFKDFVITIHDKAWTSIKDILGFLNLLTSHTNSNLTPDWVLFSIFIELSQDAQWLVDELEPEINSIRIGSKSLYEMSDVMRRIFDMEFQIYRISRFLKPKMNILRTLKTKCSKRLSKIIIRLLTELRDDFKSSSQDLAELDRILERSQDTFLALMNVEKSREANEMSKVMKRISEIALVFLPIQAIAGFLGMNVQVPFQNENTTLYFWCIVGGSISLAILAYFLRRYLFSKLWKCFNWKNKGHCGGGGFGGRGGGRGGRNNKPYIISFDEGGSAGSGNDNYNYQF